MKCYEREKLFLFAHQMLQPDELDEIRRHLSACDGCRRAVEEYDKVGAVLDDWNTADPSPWFDAGVRSLVAARGRKDSRFFGFGRVRALAACVAVMVLIVGGLVVFNHHQVVENQQNVISRRQQAGFPAASPVPEATVAEQNPLPPAEQLKMDENLSVLEDYDVVSNFDALSELPQVHQN